MRHFYNFLPDGSLGHILAAMYRFKSEQGWRRFDLSSPSRRDVNIDMCREIQEALVERGLHAVPKLNLAKALAKEDRLDSSHCYCFIGCILIQLDFLLFCPGRR